MNIRPDLRLHLKYSPALALLVLGIALVALYFGPGFAVAAGSLAIGVGMEINQKLRGEGTPAWDDALASSAAGIVAGLAYEAWIAFG